MFCHIRYCYIAQCVPTGDCLHQAEVDDAASDSGGDEGDGEGDDRQQNNRNDGLLARYNLMRAIFP